MANQHGVAFAFVELAVGFYDELIAGQGAAVLQGDGVGELDDLRGDNRGAGDGHDDMRWIKIRRDYSAR